MFCIGLFLCAASLFGTIIAQVNEIVSQLTTRKKDLDNILASYVYLKPRYFKLIVFNKIKYDVIIIDNSFVQSKSAELFNVSTY